MPPGIGPSRKPARAILLLVASAAGIAVCGVILSASGKHRLVAWLGGGGPFPGATYVTVTPWHHGGLVLTASGCRSRTPLVLGPYVSPNSSRWCGANQSWMFQRVTGGSVSIHADYDGGQRCVTVIGEDAAGARLSAQTCNPASPGPSQRFEQPRQKPGPQRGLYYIAPAGGSGLCVSANSVLENGRPASSPGTATALEHCGQASEWSIPEAPTHIETWAMDDSYSPGWCSGGLGASPSLVREWLTYAETNCGPANTKALSDCHVGQTSYCTVFQYLEANILSTKNPILSAPASEDWWLHERGYTDAAHRLTAMSSDGGQARWLNQDNAAAQRWVARYVRARYSAWDGLELDSTSASMKTQFYRPGYPVARQYSSSQELQSNRAVVHEHEVFAAHLRRNSGELFAQVDNGISPNPYLPASLPLLGHPRSVVGLLSEGNPWDYGFSPFYSELLDDIAAVDVRPGNFIVLWSYGNFGSLQARTVQEATALLGYEPGHVVSWADLEHEDLDLSVWPEEGIYPVDPIESMAAPGGRGCLAGEGTPCPRGGHNSLRVRRGPNPLDSGGGVYRREFRDCYDDGVWFGACAAIVNDTSTAVTVLGSWLRLHYGHVITMRGGDVQSGGRIDLAGAPFEPGRTRIGAYDAIILAQ